MKDTKEMLRIVGIILLGLFVLVVGVPLVLMAAGIVVGTVITLAVLLIKVAVTLAIVYLLLVGVRALPPRTTALPSGRRCVLHRPGLPACRPALRSPGAECFPASRRCDRMSRGIHPPS